MNINYYIYYIEFKIRKSLPRCSSLLLLLRYSLVYILLLYRHCPRAILLRRIKWKLQPAVPAVYPVIKMHGHSRCTRLYTFVCSNTFILSVSEVLELESGQWWRWWSGGVKGQRRWRLRRLGEFGAQISKQKTATERWRFRWKKGIL